MEGWWRERRRRRPAPACKTRENEQQKNSSGVTETNCFKRSGDGIKTESSKRIGASGVLGEAHHYRQRRLTLSLKIATLEYACFTSIWPIITQRVVATRMAARRRPGIAGTIAAEPAQGKLHHPSPATHTLWPGQIMHHTFSQRRCASARNIRPQTRGPFRNPRRLPPDCHQRARSALLRNPAAYSHHGSPAHHHSVDVHRHSLSLHEWGLHADWP